MFGSWHCILPAANGTAQSPLDQDYDLLSDFDCASDFGVQSLTDLTGNEDIVNQTKQRRLSLPLPVQPRPPLQPRSRAKVCDCPLCAFVPWDEFAGKTSAERAEFRRELEFCSLATGAANSIHYAGRPDAGHSFKDLRSCNKAVIRSRKRNQKYYNFKTIGRKAVEDPAAHISALKTRWEGRLDPVTKQSVFWAVQDWPRPPVRHRRYHRKDRWPDSARVQGRMTAKKYEALTLQRLKVDESLQDYDVECVRSQIEEGLGMTPAREPGAKQATLGSYMREPCEDAWTDAELDALLSTSSAFDGHADAIWQILPPAVCLRDALTDAEFDALSMDAFVDVAGPR